MLGIRPLPLRAFVRASGLSALLLPSLAIASLAAGCGGGGGGSDPEYGANDLYVVDMDLDQLDGVSLNTPMTIEFSEYVLPETIRHDTIQVRLGPRFGIQAFGDFKVAGNIVTFFPQLPARADLSDSGFRPQADYRVTVAGAPKVDQVQAYTGRPLIRTFVGNFSTAATTSPDLFTTDTYKDEPPPVVRFTNPPDTLPVSPWTQPGGAVDVPTDTEVQLVFNRVPLAPATITTSNVSLTMIERIGVAQNRPIQGTPVVEQSFEGTTLRFVPAFPLADQARYVLRVENRVTDLTGAYDVSDNLRRTLLRSQAESGLDPALTAFALAHPEEVDPRTFLIFSTRDEPTKDLALFLNFDGLDLDQNGTGGLDKNLSNADFNGGVPGAVAGFFTAPGGNGSLGDLKPIASTTLNTNSPSAVNGTFNYQTIDIPANVTVTMVSTPSNIPASLLSLKGTTINSGGVVGASGSKGSDAEQNYNNTALPSSAGGLGGPGGARGADNYTGTKLAPMLMNAPTGPDAPNNGGRGGQGGYTGSGQMSLGGGGGGGSHQYPGNAGTAGTYASYSTWTGAGGSGAAAGGIQPTSTATGDGKTFYQQGVGGGGGGAGGTTTYSTWRNAGAGGGGGGGAILLKSAGDITIKGQVIAKGGPGGNVGNYYYYGGGGGGGGGGAVAVYANGRLDVAGARFDTAGGSGGLPYTYGYSGPGGPGGGGFVQLEDQDGAITGTGTATMVPDYYTGKFDPTGTAFDAPSVYVSTWFNTGVFDPILQPFSNLDFTDQNYAGCTIKYEFQMAIEDVANFGHANTNSINTATQVSNDTNKASQFVTFKDPSLGLIDITSQMNGKGYQFYRLRITFTLKDGQKRNDPVPFVDRLRIRVKY